MFILRKLWELAITPVTFVVLSCLWCLDLGIGSVVAYNRDPKFWMKMDSVPFNVWMQKFAPAELPYSLWVYILVALTWLMVISLLLCTVHWFFRRKSVRRGPAELLLHFGFMLVFAGFVFGSGWGQREQNIQVLEGQVVSVESMGVQLKLDGITVVTNDKGEELDHVTNLSLIGMGGELLKSGTVGINHPLINGTTVVYPMGGGKSTVGAVINVQGLGELSAEAGNPAYLPDRNKIVVKGSLEEGQRYRNYVGPGSFLVLTGPGGQELYGEFFGGHQLFSSGPLGNIFVEWKAPIVRTQATFNVHRDPGIQLVLWGAIILTLGTFWAFLSYIRRGT